MVPNIQFNAAADSDVSDRPGPRVLVIDALSARRNATVCQLTAMLPEVIISECSDTSGALWTLAAARHDLVMLDVSSGGEQSSVASQYWRLTAPDMHQLLIYEDSAAKALAGGSGFDLTRCSWDEMPAPLTRWIQVYRQEHGRRM